MSIEPIAVFRSPLGDKFGVPRQSGLAPSLDGRIELTGRFRNPDALRGMEGFDYIWLLWSFDRNPDNGFSPTVRPPRLGGNERIGVFASRSPFRPNGIGISSVRVESVDFEHCAINVTGADLADGTPIIDIKPYIEYTDAHTGIRNGFVDTNEWTDLRVSISEDILESSAFPADKIQSLKEILALDPRPAYHGNPAKVYGMDFAGFDIKFKVNGNNLTVVAIFPIKQTR